MEYDLFLKDWENRFLEKMCTIEQLKRLVKINRILKDDYERITGEKLEEL